MRKRKNKHVLSSLVITAFVVALSFWGYQIVFAQKNTVHDTVPVIVYEESDKQDGTDKVTEAEKETELEVLKTEKEEISDLTTVLAAESVSKTEEDQEEITETEETIETTLAAKESELPAVFSLSVPEVYQNPELPTGCESVALTMMLMYEGFVLEKTTIADEFLIYDAENFAVGYVGDPYSSSGAGCFPPAIVATANRFLRSQGSNKYAVNLSGSAFEALLSYVASGEPVAVWSTMYMQEPGFTGQYVTENGTTYPWYRAEHCVVITGYNLNTGTVIVNDPLEGIVERDLQAFKQLYEKIGQFAVVIL